MLFAFKRSKIAFAAVLVLTVVIIALIWLRDQSRPLYIPLVASILMAGVGVLTALLLGNILANMENTRYLGYLHMELDPEKFLKVYRDVPSRLNKGNRNAAIARSYLADGYWADGQFEKALEALGEMPDEKSMALFGLYAEKKCAIYQAMGNTEAAEQALAQLALAADGCHSAKQELSKNLHENLALYRQQQNVLTGQALDRAALSRAFKQAQYNLRRLEIARIFQLNEEKNQVPAPQTTREYLEKNSGKTFFARL